LIGISMASWPGATGSVSLERRADVTDVSWRGAKCIFCVFTAEAVCIDGSVEVQWDRTGIRLQLYIWDSESGIVFTLGLRIIGKRGTCSSRS
jgi:hypothetical protein